MARKHRQWGRQAGWPAPARWRRRRLALALAGASQSCRRPSPCGMAGTAYEVSKGDLDLTIKRVAGEKNMIEGSIRKSDDDQCVRAARQKVKNGRRESTAR